jgi:hypothetical protein
VTARLPTGRSSADTPALAGQRSSPPHLRDTCSGRTPSVSASEWLTLASARRSVSAASCGARRVDVVQGRRVAVASPDACFFAGKRASGAPAVSPSSSDGPSIRRTRGTRCASLTFLRPGLRRLRGQRSVAQPGTVRGLENYPGRGLTWRCSCQSSPAASSASWMRCHAAPSDSSSRMRTCPRSSGICVPRPRWLATAASRSSARLPGRVTWTMIAVSGTRVDRSRGPPTHPARATRLRCHRPGTSPAAGLGRDGWAAAERTVRPLGVVVVHEARRTRSSWRGPTISSQSKHSVCLGTTGLVEASRPA